MATLKEVKSRSRAVVETKDTRGTVVIKEGIAVNFSSYAKAFNPHVISCERFGYIEKRHMTTAGDIDLAGLTCYQTS